MVPEGINDRKNQGFTNISSSREFTIMFEITKTFSHFCLAICGEKIDNFPLEAPLNGSRTQQKAHNLSPIFCRAK